MTTILLGTNRFTGFRAIFGAPGRPILCVDETAAVWLDVPEDPSRALPGLRVISDAAPVANSPVVVVRAGDKTSCGLFYGVGVLRYALVLATVLEPSLVHVRLDLRPAGIAIYDDYDGLHVGDTRIAMQDLQGTDTAIWLG